MKTMFILTDLFGKDFKVHGPGMIGEPIRFKAMDKPHAMRKADKIAARNNWPSHTVRRA